MAFTPVEVDSTALRLQLEELQHKQRDLQDSKLALQLFLQQDSSGTNEGITTAYDDLTDDFEEQQLQEQIASVSCLLAVAEDQKAALNTVHLEEAQQAASLQLATALQAQEEWDATVLRPHDAALARAIARCKRAEWRERGDMLENPIDLTGRPMQPDVQESSTRADTLAQDTASAVAAAEAAAAGAAAAAAATTAVQDCSNRSSSRGKCPHGADPSAEDMPNPTRRRQQAQCGICFESFPADSMFSATLPAEMASSSRAAGRCSHKFCPTCMRQYVVCEVQARKFPIFCPNHGCDEQLASSDVQQLLANDTQNLQVYQLLEAEQVIDTARRVYCPYKDCSVLLERPEPEGQGVGQDAPYECPMCHRSFCLSRGIAGWHAGMSCQEFQDLPADLKSAEDAAMLHIAKQKQWKRCPAAGCGHLVERTDGCNHMVCRCGCDFCYACGTKYTSTRPTANNVYGTQGCDCDLFQVPQDPADVHAPVPRVLHQANADHADQTRPFRNGRLVSRTRCRHAASVHDCPHGPRRCWFWHDEDDAAAAGEEGLFEDDDREDSAEDAGFEDDAELLQDE